MYYYITTHIYSILASVKLLILSSQRCRNSSLKSRERESSVIDIS